MTDMTDDRFGGERALVNWPAEVAEEPNYPTLSPPALDLASDVLVLSPAYDLDEDL